ncbi:MAG: DUF308 domain-containing protein [Firmicutes bacterium]|nr:DUF308 domain-containing protein [Bacillota bacterium]
MNYFNSVKMAVKISTAVAAVIGLLFLIWPSFTVVVMCVLCGAALIAVGILRTRTYLNEVKNPGMPPLNLALGLFLIIAGITVIAENKYLRSLFTLVLMLLVVLAACILIQRTYDLVKSHVAEWWMHGIGALVIVILAILVLIFRSRVLIGLSLIFAAVAVIASEIFIQIVTGKVESPVTEPAAPAPVEDDFLKEADEAPVDLDSFNS